jgi:hypothetical protein
VLLQNAVGGNGGRVSSSGGNVGNGGLGGSGTSNLTNATNSGGGDVYVQVNGVAGNGGRGQGVGYSGGAGGSADATALGSSSNGGGVYINLDLEAGIGGAGDTGADGGVGGSINSALSGDNPTTGTVYFQTQAYAGSGGDSSLGNGGAGGNVAVNHTLTNSLGSISELLVAYGGDGGNSADAGSGGQGGTATAEVYLTGHGDVFAQAVAGGGLAGTSVNGPQGNSGTAASIARATTAAGGHGMAYAGVAGDGSNNVDAIYVITETSTVSPTASTAFAQAGFKLATPGSTPPVGAETYGNGTLVPLLADVTALQAGNPNNQAVFTGPSMPFALGTLGVVNLSGAAEDYSSSFNLAFDQPMSVYLGLLNPTSTGGGFDTLELTVVLDGNTLVDEQFTDLATATAYFTDHVLNTPLMGSDMTINMQVTSHISGDGFGFDLEVAPVPEPSTVALVLLSLILLGVPAWRKWHQARGLASGN